MREKNVVIKVRTYIGFRRECDLIILDGFNNSIPKRKPFLRFKNTAQQLVIHENFRMLLRKQKNGVFLI